MKNKPECKVCENGFLELKDLPCFPTDEVRWLSKAALVLGVIGLIVCALGVSLAFERRHLDSDVLMLVVYASGSVILALVGAIFSMKKPVLQCTNCSATTPAS